ncbi:MAG: phage Gp37/Gp68 family protein [Roseateles sp.]|nr:MAG: phage Gp37/Gp68 family protein [Roseateles sp.]
MAEATGIEWADSTFNAWTGCQAVSPGCDHCYAAQWAARAGRDFAERKRTKTWADPVRWNSKRFMQCQACGWRGECAAEMIGCGACGSITHLEDARRRVFCNSLGDWLDIKAPMPTFVDLLDLVRLTTNLDWLLLTKRIGAFKMRLGSALDYVLQKAPHRKELAHWIVSWLDGDQAPANVWVGITVVNQAEADRDIPKLIATPAATRFLSIEPMLGPISMRWLSAWPENTPTTAQSSAGSTNHLDGLRRLDWVICGGESTPHARPMRADWARSLRDQCAAAGVPFLFKQWGEWLPGSQTCDVGNQMAAVGACTRGHRWDDGTHSWRVGKPVAGRLLDGVEHNNFPRSA